MAHLRSTAIGFVIAAALSQGCEEEVQVGPRPAGAGTPRAASPDAGASAETETPVLPYRDEDFVENDTNRDPFRSYAKMFQARAPDVPARDVKMSNTTIDQMKLIAIISGVARPRAMIVDADNVGQVVERGDYVGRPEVVQSGGADGIAVTLNWRVARIWPNEVVLTREDPTAPNRPALTRKLELHDEGANQTKRR